jgi:hypothetical protein
LFDDRRRQLGNRTPSVTRRHVPFLAAESSHQHFAPKLAVTKRQASIPQSGFRRQSYEILTIECMLFYKTDPTRILPKQFNLGPSKFLL